MRKFFPEKSYRTCSGETSPKLFFKKSNFKTSLDQQSKVLYSLLLLNVQVEEYQNILKLKLPLPHIKLF